MKIIGRIFSRVCTEKSTDSEDVKKRKSEMFSNTYCLIGFGYTVLYLFLDIFIDCKRTMAFIAIGSFVAIWLTMYLSVSKVRKLIENNHPKLDQVQKKLQIAATFSGWVAPIIFVVSIIVNSMP